MNYRWVFFFIILLVFTYFLSSKFHTFEIYFSLVNECSPCSSSKATYIIKVLFQVCEFPLSSWVAMKYVIWNMGIINRGYSAVSGWAKINGPWQCLILVLFGRQWYAPLWIMWIMGLCMKLMLQNWIMHGGSQVPGFTGAWAINYEVSAGEVEFLAISRGKLVKLRDKYSCARHPGSCCRQPCLAHGKKSQVNFITQESHKFNKSSKSC